MVSVPKKGFDVWGLLNAGWFSLLIGTLIGLTGLWLAVVFYKRGRQISRLRYIVGAAQLIGNAPTRFSDGLEVRFDGQVVPRVTSTTYGVWNAGTTTIRGSDIVEADPLRLELAEEAQILRAVVDGATRDVNAANVAVAGPKQVQIRFDYLDPGDGFRVQVVHSGSLNALRGVGTIRGLPSGLEPFTPRSTDWIADLLFLAFIVPMSLIIVYSVITSLAKQSWATIGLTAIGVVVVGAATVFFYRLAARRSRTPKTPKIRGVPDTVASDPTFRSWPVLFKQHQASRRGD